MAGLGRYRLSSRNKKSAFETTAVDRSISVRYYRQMIALAFHLVAQGRLT